MNDNPKSVQEWEDSLKADIIELTGEDPVDVLGEDWDLQAQEYLLQESING